MRGPALKLVLTELKYQNLLNTVGTFLGPVSISYEGPRLKLYMVKLQPCSVPHCKKLFMSAVWYLGILNQYPVTI
jgi:hypothetical protein